MPISHKNKLIFIHIPKTGGQSIEKALGLYGVDGLGSDEVGLNIGYGVIQNVKALQHCNLKEMLSFEIISEVQVKEYYKFLFVRNPWDRVVSEYFWNIRFSGRRAGFCSKITFPEFVDKYIGGEPLESNITDDHFFPQSDFVYNSNGEMAVDYVGRFETLESDFYKVCEVNNIPRIKLPHVQKTKRDHYSVYYDSKSKKRVEKYYMRDIDNFKYVFETRGSV